MMPSKEQTYDLSTWKMTGRYQDGQFPPLKDEKLLGAYDNRRTRTKEDSLGKNTTHRLGPLPSAGHLNWNPFNYTKPRRAGPPAMVKRVRLAELATLEPLCTQERQWKLRLYIAPCLTPGKHRRGREVVRPTIEQAQKKFHNRRSRTSCDFKIKPCPSEGGEKALGANVVVTFAEWGGNPAAEWDKASVQGRSIYSTTGRQTERRKRRGRWLRGKTRIERPGRTYGSQIRKITETGAPDLDWNK